MSEYEGYQISCGCHCKRDGAPLFLEGVEDAGGAHYCVKCDDYVRPVEAQCKHRTPALIRSRQAVIAKHYHQGVK
jgi:hypothetical protein